MNHPATLKMKRLRMRRKQTQRMEAEEERKRRKWREEEEGMERNGQASQYDDHLLVTIPKC